MEFFGALLQFTFLQHALLAGALASVACGIVGSYVVTRRITYLADGIAHCVLGGMGVAHYLRVVHGWTWLEPLHGALAAALLAALILGLVSLYAREREDTVISALWSVGMAVGVLFIARTPGYAQDLMGYLFGNVLLVSTGNLWLLAGLDAVILAVACLFHHQLQALCFDEECARLRGLKVHFYYLLLLGVTALTVVLLATVVGIVMLIALLSLPVAVAGQFSKTLGQLMLWSSLLSLAFISFGLALSYAPNLPAGATTVVLAGAVYLVAAGVARVKRLRK